MRMQVVRMNFKASNRYVRQYEMETTQRYTTGDESDIPPPNNSQILASPGVAISLEKFRDELDNNSHAVQAETTFASLDSPIRQQLLRDSINDALPTTSDRVRSIRKVTLVIAVQILFAYFCALWLLSRDFTDTSIKLVALVALVASAMTFSRFGCALQPAATVLCFGVFSISLPLTLTLADSFLDSQTLLALLANICAVVTALALYAWTTEYEEWSGNLELVFTVVAVVFGSLVMILVLDFQPQATILTAVASLFVGLVYGDCSKDSLVPAATLDQLLVDVMTVHVGVVSGSAFILRHKASKLARKANWF